MTMPCRYFAFILFFSNVIFCEGLENPNTKKIEKLKQEIGLKTTADFDNYAYNILVEKLDSLGIKDEQLKDGFDWGGCLLYTSPSPRDATLSRMPSSA